MKSPRVFRACFFAVALLLGPGCDKSSPPTSPKVPEIKKPAKEPPAPPSTPENPETVQPRRFDFSRDIPTAPPSQIFDTVGFFQPDARTSLSLKLNEISNNEKIHIYLAVIANLPPDDVQSLAGALNGKWLKEDIGGVLVLSFGKKPQFFLVAGGPGKAKLPGTELEDASKRAIKQGLDRFKSGDVRGGCLTALDEFLWEIRKLQGKEKPKGEFFNLPPLTLRGQWYVFWRGAGSQQRKLIIAAGFLGLLILGSLAWYLYRRWKYRPRHLPEPLYRFRLGAPYSGGNNARVNFGKKRSGQS